MTIKKLSYVANPYLYQVAEGNVPDHTPWSKTGYNADLDTGTEHIWAVGGTYVFPPSAMQLEVYSASANDTSDGTGVQQVQITYLDDTYTEKTEIVTLNGGTQATVAKNILRVNNFRAYRLGANKVAAGIISLRETDDSPVYSQISLGATRARNSAVTVPLGKTLYITSCTFSAVGAATGKDVLFTARCSYDDKRGELIDFMMPFIEVGVMDGSFYREFEVPIKLPAKTDITVTGTAGNNDTIASSILRGWVET
jgi:hypothetical protein